MKISDIYTQTTLLCEEFFIVSYQRVTRYQLLVDKKLRVCQQGINFLSTNS